MSVALKRRGEVHHAPWWFGIPHPFPFVLAVVSVTALVAANADEGIRLENLREPLLAAVLTAFVGWTAGGLTSDRGRQALVAAAVSLPLLLSGYVFAGVRNLDLTIPIRSGIEVGLCIALILVGVTFVFRMASVPQGILSFLNAFSFILLLFTLPSVWAAGANGDAYPVASFLDGIDEHAEKPDIYLIVVDEFTGSGSLSRNYGYDITEFLDALRARGFALPTEQKSNYMLTSLSVGSMLQREYMHDLDDYTPKYRDLNAVYEGLEFSRTAADLRALGYEFAYVGSSYPPLASNRLADIQYTTTPSRDFERLWFSMSMLRPAVVVWCHVFQCAQRIPFEETGEETLRRLSFLTHLIRRPGPKFVFAHLLLPHGPYRLTRDCEPREPSWIFGPNRIVDDSIDSHRYLEQLECTSRMLLGFVDSVRVLTHEEPIIILQADHGHGSLGPIPPTLSEATAGQVVERFDVFSAYSGPGAIEDSLANVRTPVNLFRTVFRVLWRADEEPLPDYHFWSMPSQPLIVERVASH